MEAKVRFLGHAVHPILVNIPIGFLFVLPIFDVVQMWTASAFWAQFCFWLNVIGLAGGLIAAAFGFIDWYWGIPKGTRAYRVGLQHMLVNVAALACYAIGLGFRIERNIVNPLFAPFCMDLSGLMILALGGWLGGELVEQHGMGVNTGAHLNAPSSLDAGRLVRSDEPRPSEPQPV
jgi:uncharacterized membrane protein